MKSDENRSDLHILLICSMWLYSLKNRFNIGSQTRHSRRLSGLLKPQTDGTGPPGVNDDGLTLYDNRVLWFLKVCLLLTLRSQKRRMKLDHRTDRQTDVKDCWHYRSAKIQGLWPFPRNWFIWEKKRKRTKQEQIRTLRFTLELPWDMTCDNVLWRHVLCHKLEFFPTWFNLHTQICVANC